LNWEGFVFVKLLQTLAKSLPFFLYADLSFFSFLFVFFLLACIAKELKWHRLVPAQAKQVRANFSQSHDILTLSGVTTTYRKGLLSVAKTSNNDFYFETFISALDLSFGNKLIFSWNPTAFVFIKRKKFPIYEITLFQSIFLLVLHQLNNSPKSLIKKIFIFKMLLNISIEATEVLTSLCTHTFSFSFLFHIHSHTHKN